MVKTEVFLLLGGSLQFTNAAWLNTQLVNELPRIKKWILKLPYSNLHIGSCSGATRVRVTVIDCSIRHHSAIHSAAGFHQLKLLLVVADLSYKQFLSSLWWFVQKKNFHETPSSNNTDNNLRQKSKLALKENKSSFEVNSPIHTGGKLDWYYVLDSIDAKFRVPNLMIE